VGTRDAFSARFWGDYGHYPPEDIYNVDETGIFYDMPPRRIWAERGESSKIKTQQKQSARITAVLTIRSDGTIFFI
jgi:hypothetical protein